MMAQEVVADIPAVVADSVVTDVPVIVAVIDVPEVVAVPYPSGTRSSVSVR